MACERLSKRVLRFMGANHDLEQCGERGVRMRFCETEGRIEMSIVIMEDTPMKAVRDFLPTVREWRDRLKLYQGLWTKGGEGYLYEMLRFRHQGGWSYRKLAEWINRRIVGFLEGGDPEKAIDLMRAMRVEAPEKAAQEALDNLAEGRSAFPPESPVDRLMVRYLIREWKRKNPVGWQKE